MGRTPTRACVAIVALLVGCYEGTAQDSVASAPATFGAVSASSETSGDDSNASLSATQTSGPSTDDSQGTDATDPVTTDAVTTDPATSDPATSDPVTTDPATTDSATSDPTTTDPATTDPTTTDPATTDPTTDSDSDSNSNPKPSCGDGIVDPDEPCDDGNDSNDDACTNACVNATCGDGFIHAGVEQCDDADDDDHDACTNNCENAVCGDGFIQAGVEECDDGNMNAGDLCSAACFNEFKYAFVTSELYDGALGGLDGADLRCQSLAQEAGLPGLYLAWLSVEGTSPSTRFTQSPFPYRRVDDTAIANNWADLIDGQLATTLNIDELGDAMPIGDTGCGGGGFATVWSATSSDGTYGGSNCVGWTSIEDSGSWGLASDLSQWSGWCGGGVCSWLSPLYCFQQ